MNSLNNHFKRLDSILQELKNINIGKKKTISEKDRKRIIKLFIQITDVKKSIVKRLFMIKGKEVSARERVIQYLKTNLGQTITGKELGEVSGISEYARRIRELRHECGGWQISTGMNRSNLRPDEYILESLEQRPRYERMNSKTWAKVLKRDNFTCQNCGWRKGDPQTNNRRFLEVHHKNPVRTKGKPVFGNLTTLCNICHDAIEAIS